ncbi:ATP-dependent RNA helicase MAK5 [Rickenella mellea]|uniref:RNA helicase n=1 Tax=Rickenella mellea TaxID=50990 RepID=A0A4Y7PUJ5_9AGAM|nr:ATP-dependent RNA helicase MAK5 [Rickenella mellea]
MLLSKKASLKRKLKSSSLNSSRKKSKVVPVGVDELPWKTLTRPSVSGVEEDVGLLMLEEVEDVEVVYEDTGSGRFAKFNFKGKAPQVVEDTPEGGETTRAEITDVSAESQKLSDEILENEGSEEDTFDTDALPNWAPHTLHPILLQSLHRRNFTDPTPIQAKALPVALKGKDVVGIAETGSGKTLAYGIPILQYILSKPKTKSNDKRQLKALILAPTRELALQVSSHLKACLSTPGPTEKSDDAGAPRAKGPPRVSVAAIVGGMSAQKQRRVLERGVDVLIATPGRLWDLLSEDDSLATQLKALKFLVLDEADRMIETGHFAELDNIVRLTLRQSREDDNDPEFLGEQRDDEEREIADGEDNEDGGKDELQTFVFSATLSKDLQKNLKKAKRKGVNRKATASTLDELLMKLDFRDPDPEIIDLSPEGVFVSSLKQSQVECMSADKDVYLYYFLLRYPGRSLIFLSSIDGIRRLSPLMELLQLKAFPLHSQLQQKQRLKNLDRFKSIPNSILLATDIAARGLDIPAVDHVIHYQIPRSADVYVHRNGRTARASREGFSLLMCAPDEKRILRGLLSSLGTLDSNEIPDMPIEIDLLDKLKARVQLARKIDTAQHKVKKEKHDKNWMRETAEAMELELDSDFADSDDGAGPKRSDKHDSKNAQLKAELKHLLSQPLIARGISKRYITSGARDIVNELIDNSHNRTMLGFKHSDARTDLVNYKTSARKRKAKPEASVEETEEWTGLGS